MMKNDSKYRTYSELITLKSFEERFEYLKLSGGVGIKTFGTERYLNQNFYRSPEWKSFRNEIIIRDNGCDLAVLDREIVKPSLISESDKRKYGIYIHHLNPITIEDIINHSGCVFDPENVVCCSFKTHQAIHYGDMSQLTPSKPTERKPFDTCPWRKEG